eukprot:GFUD01031264.1.p1 GENE.GFUD01031264.1~~GFUD01031264.1.p1  ORF type:complete len:502 (-),score=158.47 GFUD01031264.1:59-1564(-)
MGRLGKRLNELEIQQGEIQLQLEKLDKEEKGECCKREDLDGERQVILRKLTGVNIRIRNLQRNRKKEITVKEGYICEKTLTEDVAVAASTNTAVVDIDDKDANFDPAAVKLNTSRPVMRFYPNVPLPHSQPNWDKEVMIGRRRERPVVRWTDWEGQFTGLEEEERVEEAGRKWFRQERSNNNRKDVGRARDKEGRNVQVNLSPAQVISSSGQKSPTCHSKTSRKTPPAITATASAKKPSLKISNIPKKILETVLPSSSPVKSPPTDCICYRPPHLVTCSSPSCCHSFYGRVSTSCPHHPTDHYLMDHPTICPICKAGPIVEDRNLTLPQLLTQIKIKPVPGRKETTKSLIAQKSGLSVEEKGRWRINSKHTIESKKSVKYKDSQIFKKPQQSPRTVPHLTVQRHLLDKTGGGEHLTGRERKYLTSGQEVKEVEGAATKPVTTMLTSVKTKLVTTRKDAASVLSSPVVNMALVLPCEDQGTLRERLRKRLILSKSGGQRGEK